MRIAQLSGPLSVKFYDTASDIVIFCEMNGKNDVFLNRELTPLLETLNVKLARIRGVPLGLEYIITTEKLIIYLLNDHPLTRIESLPKTS